MATVNVRLVADDVVRGLKLRPQTPSELLIREDRDCGH
jgi:hypothetical protein